MTIENRDKPFMTRDGSGEEEMPKSIGDVRALLIRNRNVVSELITYFTKGELPRPIETYPYRIPGFKRERVIDVGYDLVLLSLGGDKIPLPFYQPEVVVTYFGVADNFPDGFPDLEILKNSFESPTFSGSVTWPFSNIMSVEQSLAIFMTEMSPEEEGNIKKQKMFDELSERGQQRALEEPEGFPLERYVLESRKTGKKLEPGDLL